jgi:hypothetical protein
LCLIGAQHLPVSQPGLHHNASRIAGGLIYTLLPSGSAEFHKKIKSLEIVRSIL